MQTRKTTLIQAVIGEFPDIYADDDLTEIIIKATEQYGEEVGCVVAGQLIDSSVRNAISLVYDIPGLTAAEQMTALNDVKGYFAYRIDMCIAYHGDELADEKGERARRAVVDDQAA